MSRIVRTRRDKIKESQPIDLDKKDPKLLSITDSKIKEGKSIQIDKSIGAEHD